MSRAALPAISDAVAQQAADWLTVLMSDEAGEQQRRDWQHWRDADPEHARAWAHIEAFSQRFGQVHKGAATQALAGAAAPAASHKRRQLLVWLGVAGGAGMLAAQTGAWDEVGTLRADYRTATGERRDVMLADGSALSLNTGSAVNVRFDGERRLIELLAGEILIVSGHGAGTGVDHHAPLLVATREGLVRALGTRFSVRQQDGQSSVAVFESAVEIRPLDGIGTPLLLPAGRSTTFTRRHADVPHAVGVYADAWSRGQMIVDDVTLGEFLADLSRYRPGVIRCAPEVAQLRLSGVFPLFDTERILNMLPNSLPVQVRSRTRYWVSVEPAP